MEICGKLSDNKVKASELLSVLLNLAEECCRLLDEVHSSNQKLQIEMKDPDNPVTIADLTIQKSIEYVLTSLYPGINIIGEEDPATYEHIKPLVALSDIKKDTITDEFLLKNFESRKEAISKSVFKDEVLEDPFSFNAEDLHVWIDPIDGTRELCAGRLENVTCMIGVVFNKTPIMGLVHRPYIERSGTLGDTYFGSLEFGIYKCLFDRTWDKRKIEEREFVYMEPFSTGEEISNLDNYNLNVNVCWHRENAQNEMCLEYLKPCTFVEDGGAGKRVLRVLYDNNEMWVFPGYGQSGWDMCGPEALIRGRLGITTDFYEERFRYNKEIDPVKGCIFAKKYDSLSVSPQTNEYFPAVSPNFNIIASLYP